MNQSSERKHLSFQRLWENMESSRKGGHPDDKSMEAIRNGINVREDFWDDFLLVINNSGALSELLDIPVTKIAGWHHKVKESLERVKQADAVPEPKDKGKMIKTGMPEDPNSNVITQAEI